MTGLLFLAFAMAGAILLGPTIILGGYAWTCFGCTSISFCLAVLAWREDGEAGH